MGLEQLGSCQAFPVTSASFLVEESKLMQLLEVGQLLEMGSCLRWALELAHLDQSDPWGKMQA